MTETYPLPPISAEATRDPSQPLESVTYAEFYTSAPEATLRALAAMHPSWTRREFEPNYTVLDGAGVMAIGVTVPAAATTAAAAPAADPEHHKTSTPARTGTVLYVSVASLAAATATALEHGATKFGERVDMPGMGAHQVLVLPGGFRLGLYEELPEPEIAEEMRSRKRRATPPKFSSSDDVVTFFDIGCSADAATPAPFTAAKACLQALFPSWKFARAHPTPEGMTPEHPEYDEMITLPGFINGMLRHTKPGEPAGTTLYGNAPAHAPAHDAARAAAAAASHADGFIVCVPEMAVPPHGSFSVVILPGDLAYGLWVTSATPCAQDAATAAAAAATAAGEREEDQHEAEPAAKKARCDSGDASSSSSGAHDADAPSELAPLPPITTHLTREAELPNEAIVYAELHTTAPDDTLRVLGRIHPTWTRRPFGDDYTVVDNVGALALGVVRVKGAPIASTSASGDSAATARTVVYVGTPALAEATRKAVSLGATLDGERVDMPGCGSYQRLQAPGGVPIALYEAEVEERVDPEVRGRPRRELPKTAADRAGGVYFTCFSSNDVEATKSFLAALFPSWKFVPDPYSGGDMIMMPGPVGAMLRGVRKYEGSAAGAEAADGAPAHAEPAGAVIYGYVPSIEEAHTAAAAAHPAYTPIVPKVLVGDYGAFSVAMLPGGVAYGAWWANPAAPPMGGADHEMQVE